MKQADFEKNSKHSPTDRIILENNVLMLINKLPSSSETSCATRNPCSKVPWPGLLVTTKYRSTNYAKKYEIGVPND